MGGGFLPRTLLDIEGTEDFDNVHYHVSQTSTIPRQYNWSLGAGLLAVDWALAFDKIVWTTIIHRRDNFRALEIHSVEDQKHSSVQIKHLFVSKSLDWMKMDKQII